MYIKKKKYVFYLIFTSFFIIILTIIVLVQNNYKETYRSQFNYEKEQIEFYLKHIQNDLFAMSSDMISMTINNILDRQLGLMNVAEISALNNNLLISDNIKTYVQFHNLYKTYLDEIYFKDYLSNFFIYNKTYDQLSPYNIDPVNIDLASKTIFNISEHNNFSVSNFFINDGEKYFYLATKNREMKAGVFTGEYIGYILYEINLKYLNTSLNIINKSEFLNLEFLPVNAKDIEEFYEKSTLSDIYFFSTIDFLDSNIYVYKGYSKAFFNYIFIISSLFYIFCIFVIFKTNIDYGNSLMKNISSLNYVYKDNFEKDPEKFIIQLLAKKDFENDFLKKSKEEIPLNAFKNVYLKYYNLLQLPNYVVFYSLKNMNFVFTDKIDIDNNHIDLLEKLQLNSECIKEIRTNYFDNSLNSLNDYIENVPEEIINSINNYYVNLFSIQKNQHIIIIKDTSKEKIENFKSILKNL